MWQMHKSRLDQSDNNRWHLIYLELLEITKLNKVVNRWVTKAKAEIVRLWAWTLDLKCTWWNRRVTMTSCDLSITQSNLLKPNKRKLQCRRDTKIIMECLEGTTRKIYIYLISRLWPTQRIQASCISSMVATKVLSSRPWPLVAIIKVAVAFHTVPVRLQSASTKVALTWTSR